MMYRQISYKNGRNPSFSLHLCRRAGGFLRADLVVRQSVHRGGFRGGSGWREKVSPEQSPGTPPRDFGYCRKMEVPKKRACGTVRGIKRKGSPRKDFGIPQRPAETEREKERLPRLRKTRVRGKRKGSRERILVSSKRGPAETEREKERLPRLRKTRVRYSAGKKKGFPIETMGNP